jgi:hypothetical protein
VILSAEISAFLTPEQPTLLAGPGQARTSL